VLRERPVLLAISRIGLPSRKCQRRITLTNATFITPRSPAVIAQDRYTRGSKLDANIRGYWVTFGCKSTLERLDDCYCLCEDPELRYQKRRKLVRHLSEMMTYIDNNSHLIPNYGEKYRYGETITTAFVESIVNEVVAKRVVKKPQMQWSRQGAHCLLQTRTDVLNGELRNHFEEWYPELSTGTHDEEPVTPVKMVA